MYEILYYSGKVWNRLGKSFYNGYNPNLALIRAITVSQVCIFKSKVQPIWIPVDVRY